MRSMQRTAAVGKTRPVAISAPWDLPKRRSGSRAYYAMRSQMNRRFADCWHYCFTARRGAPRGADGRFIPLSEQDPHIWLAPLIDEAERELAVSVAHARLGRFQIEAAIQSVHAERARTGRTDWAAIAMFYDELTRLAPSIGAAVARAAAHAEVQGAQAGFALLDQIDVHSVVCYQPYWAVRGDLLRQLNRAHEAAEAFDRAIGLTDDHAVCAFLLERRRRLSPARIPSSEP